MSTAAFPLLLPLSPNLVISRSVGRHACSLASISSWGLVKDGNVVKDALHFAVVQNPPVHGWSLGY